MRHSRLRLRPRHWVLLALVALAVGLFLSDFVVFTVPERMLNHLRGKVARKLQAREICLALSFDGPFPLNHATAIDLELAHVRSVPGEAGDARRFKGDADALVNTDARWEQLGANYTALMRLRLDAKGPETQEICGQDLDQRIGFTLHEGRLRFSFPTQDGTGAFLEAPRPVRDNRWHTVIAVVDAAHSRARLFLDGKLADECSAAPADMPSARVTVGPPQWHPLYADLDELVFWKRVLSDRELRRASQPGWTAVRDTSPLLAFRVRFWQGIKVLLPTAVRVLERLHPQLLLRTHQPDIPALDIILSKKDRRHFLRVHEDAMQSGCRTDRGANLRHCRFATASGFVPGKLGLDNPYIYPLHVDRPAFIALVDLDGDGVEEQLRLYPPEDFTLMHPSYGPPLSISGQPFVWLSLSGDPLGLYCIDVFRHTGESWVLEMKHFSPDSPLRRNPVRVFDEWDLLSDEERTERRDRILATITADPHAHWSRRQWLNTRKELLTTLGKVNMTPPRLTAHNAIGTNPAPFYVTGDLDLSNPTLRGIARWESSRPELVSAEGKVTRPGGDVPVRVTLTGYDDADSVVARLEFRVMPEAPRLPALFLYLIVPPSKYRRTDFTAEFYPAGGGTPRFLAGFAGHHAGLKPRGNTSFAKGIKKPLSLKFDTAHGIFGPASDRGLYLLGGYSDSTRLRSHFCYDLFRMMGTLPFPDGSTTHHEAPEVGWLEVFVNNDYFGVFEMCTRPKAPLFAPEPAPSLFKIQNTTPLFAEVSARAFAQEVPDLEDDSREEEVLHLMRLMTIPALDRSFREAMERELDLANITDFHLLVNFTGNADGRVTNFLLAREPVSEALARLVASRRRKGAVLTVDLLRRLDAMAVLHEAMAARAPAEAEAARRYFFVPWDYDKTFREEIPPRDYSNALHRRLRNEIPGFREGLVQRWRALRAHPFATETLLAKLDAEASFLAPYMAFEYELLNLPELDYDQEVGILRNELQRHLRWMDRWISNQADKL